MQRNKESEYFREWEEQEDTVSSLALGGKRPFPQQTLSFLVGGHSRWPCFSVFPHINPLSADIVFSQTPTHDVPHVQC